MVPNAALYRNGCLRRVLRRQSIANVAVGELRIGWDRPDDIDQDAVRVAEDDMALTERLIAQALDYRKACRAEPRIFCIYVRDFEVQDQPAGLAAAFRRDRLVIVLQNCKVHGGIGILLQVNIPIALEQSAEPKVTAVEGACARDIMGLDDGIVLSGAQNRISILKLHTGCIK